MKTINKTILADGRVAITLYCEPDLASELVKLAKAKNIDIEEIPKLSQDTIEQLSKIKKDVQKNSEIEKVFKMAEGLKNKSNVSDDITPQNILKNLIKGK